MKFFEDLVATLTGSDGQRAGGKRQMPNPHGDASQGLKKAQHLRQETIRQEERELKHVRETDKESQEKPEVSPEDGDLV